MNLKVGVASADWISPERSGKDIEQWGGSGWARIGQYLDLLPFDIVHGTLVWNVSHFSIMSIDGALHDTEVIVMQRLMHDDIAEKIPHAKAFGQKIINDVDDWYWGLDPSNGAFMANHPKTAPKENINHYKKIISRSDLVTVSTPYLLDRLKPFTKAELLLVPNTVDVSRFTPKRHEDKDTPTVGWVGSTAHRSGDLETVKGILVPLYKSGTIKLHHSGHFEHYPTFASRLGLDDTDVSTLPLRPHNEYPSLMVMDIGIVPLRDTPFNHAKSEIKGLEYAAAGIPFVAQGLDSYKRLYKQHGIGRVADRPNEWLKNIKSLLSASVRQEEADRNLELVKAFDIQFGVSRIIDAINTVWKL